VIHQLRLRNFKGVVEGEAELDKLTILVGPNNSGKTTILEALFLAPNPFRKVPYRPSIAVELVNELHKAGGYLFLLNKYGAKEAEIDCDGKKIMFTREPEKIEVSTNCKLQQTLSGRVILLDIDYQPHKFVMGILGFDATIKPETTELVLPEVLLLSTKLVDYAHEYMLDVWIDIANTGATAAVAKDVSRYVHEDYVNITAEPYVKGRITFYVMRSDGVRIRLSDLGHGVQLYIVNRLLYEHFRPEVVLWDDLEAHFNPRLLTHVAEWFADLVEEGKQVIVSTHSLEVIEKIIAFVEDATVLLTSLRDGKLKVRRVKPDELEEWAKAGIDPRYAEVFLL
jgi:predicted ATPase